MARAQPYGQNTAEVEEIVQDAFLKVFLFLTREPFTGNFASYFHRVVVNAGIDYYRRYRARGSAAPVEENRCSGVNVANEAPIALEREDCIRLLQQLPPTYRLVFNLYVFEGYRHPEIATRLGITEGTSRSNLFKARRTLSRLVGPYLQLNIPHPNG